MKGDSFELTRLHPNSQLSKLCPVTLSYGKHLKQQRVVNIPCNSIAINKINLKTFLLPESKQNELLFLQMKIYIAVAAAATPANTDNFLFPERNGTNVDI